MKCLLGDKCALGDTPSQHLRNCCRVILETDPATIAGRVAMRGADSELPLTEQVTLLACREMSFLYACTVS